MTKSSTQRKTEVSKKKNLSPISRLVTIFADKSKKTGKVKCPIFKKEVFSNAKITLKNCDSLQEFNSRTYLQDTFSRQASMPRIFTPSPHETVFPARDIKNRKFR